MAKTIKPRHIQGEEPGTFDIVYAGLVTVTGTSTGEDVGIRGVNIGDIVIVTPGGAQSGNILSYVVAGHNLITMTFAGTHANQKYNVLILRNRRGVSAKRRVY